MDVKGVCRDEDLFADVGRREPLVCACRINMYHGQTVPLKSTRRYLKHSHSDNCMFLRQAINQPFRKCMQTFSEQFGLCRMTKYLKGSPSII